MNERWLPVVGFSNYEVSDAGRVRSLDTKVRMGAGWRVARGRMLKCSPKQHGYREAVLSGQQSRLVHRLVLEAFVGPCPDGMEACHGNGIRADCRRSNLRWDTPEANSADRIRHGTQVRGERHGKSVLTDEIASWVRESRQGVSNIAHALGVSVNTVYRARGATYQGA